MKLYIDTGNIEEVRKAAKLGVLDGVTTNPSLIAREGKDFILTLKAIKKILSPHTHEFTISAEVTETETAAMIKQGRKLAEIDKHIIVKIPCTKEGIPAVKALSKSGIRVNVTLCFSTAQALVAAKAGAYIISPFIGRLDDINHNGLELIEEIRAIYDRHKIPTRILAASIRSPRQVSEVALRGADIATLPFNVFDKLLDHPLTAIGQERFLKDWAQYAKKK